MSQESILVVEDESKIADLLRDYLMESGFRVTCLYQGDQVVPSIKSDPPALILLDIMLPGMNGTEVCKEIRKFSNIPILCSPPAWKNWTAFSVWNWEPTTISANPSARVRWSPASRPFCAGPMPIRASDIISVGPITLDESTHQVHVEGQELHLTPSEFGLLRVMIAHPKRVFSRSQLLDKVQGYQFDGYDRTIDSHVKNLRKKIAQKLPGIDIIHTVYGVGYKFD